MTIPELLDKCHVELERQREIRSYIRSWHGRARLDMAEEMLGYGREYWDDHLKRNPDARGRIGYDVAADSAVGWPIVSACKLLGVEAVEVEE